MHWKPPKQKLSIFFDDLCPVCVAGCEWMSRRRAYVPLEFLKQSDPSIQERFGRLLVRDGIQQFIVIADDGDIYSGSAARMACLSTLKGGRLLSYLLGNPLSFWLTDFLLEWFARNRYRISSALGLKMPGISCESGHCQVGGSRSGKSQ